MKTFTQFRLELNENKTDTAKDLIHNASYRPTFGDFRKDARMSQLGFVVMSDSDISKHPAMKYSYFSKAQGNKPILIDLPKTVVQNDVDKDFVFKIIDDYDRLGPSKNKPIKVTKANNEYVVLDGHHRLAAAKALGYKKIYAVEV